MGEGFLLFAAAVVEGAVDTGVHGGVEVDVFGLAGAFVVDGVFDRRAPVEPVGTVFEADAVACFVAHGPDDDGGLILRVWTMLVIRSR